MVARRSQRVARWAVRKWPTALKLAQESSTRPLSGKEQALVGRVFRAHYKGRTNGVANWRGYVDKARGSKPALLNTRQQKAKVFRARAHALQAGGGSAPRSSGATVFGHVGGDQNAPKMKNGKFWTTDRGFRTKQRYDDYVARGGAPLGELVTRASGQVSGRVPFNAAPTRTRATETAKQAQLTAWFAGRSASLRGARR